MSAALPFAPTRPTGVRAIARIWPAVAAFLVPLAAWLWQGSIGLDLSDEGFHWYGAQRVLAGDVPLRDFQSYDVGRYYWSAAWMGLVGDDGLVAFRLGNAVLGGLTLAIVVVLIGPFGRRRAGLPVLAAASLWLWTTPDFRIADCFPPVLLAAGLARLVERPAVPRRWFEFGIAFGIATTIGINHGLYGCLGLALVLAYLRGVDGDRPPRRRWLALGLGTVTGLAPVLAMHLAVPGFTAGFVDSLRILIELGTTNLELPLPRSRPLTLLFVIAPAFWLVCAWRLGRADRHRLIRSVPGATFAAATLLALPYAHYALSRADIYHAAISMMPLLLAAFTFPISAPRWRGALLVGLAAGSAVALLPRQPGWKAIDQDALEPVTVGTDTLRLEAVRAGEVRLLQQLDARQAPGARSFYAAPYWPGAYAVLDRRSPAWEIYAIFPALPDRQRREIERLRQADIGFAVVSDMRVDSRADLGFAQTHPLIDAYLRRCLKRAPTPDTPALGHLDLYVSAGSDCQAP